MNVKRKDLLSFILNELMYGKTLLIIKTDGSTQYCDCIRNGKKPCYCNTGEWCNLKDIDQLESMYCGRPEGILYQVI